MFKNYLKTALRSLWKNRIFSIINLSGLALGMSAGLLIFLYVQFESSYDRFHTKADRIYRVVCDDKTPTQLRYESHTSAPVAPDLQHDFPQIEDYVRIYPLSRAIQIGEAKFQENRVAFADPSFFTVFDFPLVKGDAKKALKEPMSVVLSETTARRYFGDHDPIGRMVKLTESGIDVVVTGVMKDIPENSTIKADVLISMPTLLDRLNPDLMRLWDNLSFFTYVLLRKGADAATLQQAFPGFLDKYVGKQMRSSNEYFSLYLEPLKDVYMRSDRVSPVKGNYTNVRIFAIVAGFILLIACINFVNLTTARGVERAKEVGVRKVLGSARAQLAVQFLCEAILQCLIAFLVSVLLCIALLPLFNGLAGKTVASNLFEHSGYLGLFFLIALVMGIVAGSYPAVVLSGFQPVSILKGRFVTSRRGVVLRQFLVVLQFTISIVLIAGTFIVYMQLHFMRSQQLGFDKDQMLVIYYNRDGRIDAFKKELAQVAGVASSTLSSSVPSALCEQRWTKIENVSGDMQEAESNAYSVDFEFLKEYQINVVAGRGFNPAFSADSANAMIINESAAKAYGYRTPNQAIGKRFYQGREGTIVGVVKDFHYQSLVQKIEPLTMQIEPGFARCQYITLKIAGSEVGRTMETIKQLWDRIFQDKAFSYYFLDESFNNLYIAEVKFGRLFLYFSLLAIVISCLGLLGLAAYSMVQRAKEIAIRKVIGAGLPDIFYVLCSGFVKPVIVAFCIATPIAWYAMHLWLQHFAYRTIIAWWVFALTGLIAAFITLLTISYQVVKLAVANPVRSLKSDG